MKCEAEHKITWEDGTIRSLGPCDGVAAWHFVSEASGVLTAEDKNVCASFRRQVGAEVLRNPVDVVPFEFTPLEVSGNPEGGAS